MRRLRVLALAAICVAAPSARAETIEMQVNRAIERGVAVARRFLDGNGAGTTTYHKDYPEGDTALLVDRQRPSIVWWKTKLPEKLSRLRVSATTATSPGKADAVLKTGVFDGQMHEVAALPVGPDPAPDAKNRRWVEADLSAFDGREVLVALRAADGGRTSWHWEGIWIDEMEIRSGL